MLRIGTEEAVWAMVSVEHNKSVRGCARELGVAESTLRCRLPRLRRPAADGRKDRGTGCDAYGELIRQWLAEQGEAERIEGVKQLYALLLGQGYQGSYRAVLRYVKRHRPLPAVRPVRRVETAPGAQAQVDWVSRQDLASWIDCHNRAFTFLGGVAATVRIDNLKTGVASGGGPTAVLNREYASYARQMGFVIDPCRVRQGRRNRLLAVGRQPTPDAAGTHLQALGHLLYGPPIGDL